MFVVEAPQDVSLPSTLPMVKHTHRYVVKLEDTSMVALMDLGAAQTALNLTMSREFQLHMATHDIIYGLMLGVKMKTKLMVMTVLVIQEAQHQFIFPRLLVMIITVSPAVEHLLLIHYGMESNVMI